MDMRMINHRCKGLLLKVKFSLACTPGPLLSPHMDWGAEKAASLSRIISSSPVLGPVKDMLRGLGGEITATAPALFYT